ncbi:unnamed protein product, partial [Prorocentrum cordatum]
AMSLHESEPAAMDDAASLPPPAVPWPARPKRAPRRTSCGLDAASNCSGVDSVAAASISRDFTSLFEDSQQSLSDVASAIPSCRSKRRRLRMSDECGCDGGADTQSDMMTLGADGDGGSPDKSGTDSDDQPCPGCNRTRDGKCFFNAGAKTPWDFPSGRGPWCKDCYGCYRLFFSETKTLVVFRAHLQTEDGRAEWSVYFVAYISLRYEIRDGRISRTAGDARVGVIKFLFNILRMPTQPFVIQTLAKCIADGDNIENLVTIRGDDGKCSLGVFKTAIEAVSDVGCFHIDLGSFDTTAKLIRPMFSHSEADVDMYRAAFDGSAKADSVIIRAGAAGRVLEQDPRVAKLDAQLAAIIKTFEVFSQVNWSDVAKESMITPLLCKLGQLRIVFVSESRGDLVDTIDRWTHTLTGAKTALKQHRTFKKSKTYANTVAMSEELPELAKKLRDDMNMQPHPSFILIASKAFYLKLSQQSKSFLDTLTALNADPVFAAVADATDPNTLDMWMNDLFSMYFVNIGLDEDGAATEDDITQKLKGISADLSGAHEMLNAFDDKFKSHKFVIELSMICSLFQLCVATRLVSPELAAPGPSIVRWARDGVQSSERLRDISKKMKNSVIGQEVSSAVSVSMQRNAQDDVADDKLRDAMSLMASTAFPSTSTDDTNRITIRNTEVVATLSMVEVVERGLKLVAECLAMWSPIRAVEQAPKVLECMTLVRDALDMFDFVAALLLQDHFSPLVDTLDSAVEGDALDQSSFEDVLGSKQKLVAKVVHKVLPTFERGCLGNIMPSLETITKAFPDDAMGDSRSIAILLQASLAHNARVREVAMAYFNAVNNLARLGGSKSSACGTGGKRDAPVDPVFWQAVINVVTSAKKMASFSKFKFAHEMVIDETMYQCEGRGGMQAGFHSSLKGLGSDSDNWTSGLAATSFPDFARSAGFPVKVEKVLRGMFEISYSEWSKLVPLSELGWPADVPDEESPLRSQLASFIVGGAAPYKDELASVRKQVLESVEKLTHRAAAFGGILSGMAMDLLNSSTNNLDVAGLLQPINGYSEVWVQAVDVDAFVRLFNSFYEVGAIIHYLHEAVFTTVEPLSPSEVCDKDMSIKQFYETVFDLLSASTASARSAIQLMSVSEVNGIWFQDWPTMERWLDSVDTVAARCKSALFRAVVQNLSKAAARDERLAPNFRSIVNEKTYASSMAKKTLTKPALPKAIKPAMVALGKALDDARSLHEDWRLTPKIEDDETVSSDWEHAVAIHNTLKESMVVIIAVQVVEDKGADSQFADAKALLDDEKMKSFLPAALVKQLEPLASKAKKPTEVKTSAAGTSKAASSRG